MLKNYLNKMREKEVWRDEPMMIEIDRQMTR